MNRQDRPDELRDRLLGDVPDARPGFWADLTDRLESVDTDATRPRLMGMNTNETTHSRPATRTRVFALAAGAALVLGAGAVAVRSAGGGDRTVEAASVEPTSTSEMTESTDAIEPSSTTVPAPTTTATGSDPTVDPSTSSTTAPEVALQRCFGFQDPDNAEFGITVQLREYADGLVDAAVRFNEENLLEVFRGERIAETELDGAVLLTNVNEGPFFGRAEVWFDGWEELRIAEDVWLPVIACGDAPAGAFDDVDAALSVAGDPGPAQPVLTGTTCYAAADETGPFTGHVRVAMAEDGTVDARFVAADGETSRAGQGRFVSDVDILLSIWQLNGFDMEPYFEKWIVEDGSIRPNEVVPAGAFQVVDCTELPADFDG